MYSHRLLLTLAAILSMALSTGCASITRGTTEAYAVQTTPPGAEVSSSSGWRCKTPCSVKVKRRSDFVLTIQKPGYEDVTATVTSSVDGAGAAGMAGNALIGGLIGAGIDLGTGAMHSHKPNPLIVELEPSGGKVGHSDGSPSSSNATPPLRLLSEAEQSNCQLISTQSSVAGGHGDPTANENAAMSKAVDNAAEAGADAYYIVTSTADSASAIVKVAAMTCTGVK